jgi:hypothetical protein
MVDISRKHIVSRVTKSAILPGFLILMVVSGCGIHQYTNPALAKKPEVFFPKEYRIIIEPLDSALVPIRKRIFFLKNDIAKMKDKLWDGGSNQRIAHIDNNIDTARKEVSALSAIQRELLNTIYHIDPAYEEAQVVPYTGDKKKYKTIKKPILLVTLEDQRYYEDVKSGGEKLSESIRYKHLVRMALKRYDNLPDSLKPKIQPIGSPGPVRRLEPYEPPRPR